MDRLSAALVAANAVCVVAMILIGRPLGAIQNIAVAVALVIVNRMYNDWN